MVRLLDLHFSEVDHLSFVDLLTKVDPNVFLTKFGVDVSNASSLIEAKTLTISKLMTIMPQGTIDPR